MPVSMTKAKGLSFSAFDQKHCFCCISDAAVPFSFVSLSIKRNIYREKNPLLTIWRNIRLMTSTGMINSTIDDDDDYLDQLGRILPIHQSFTPLERVLIVFIVSTFVSMVGCTLLCLICPRSPLRRKYYPKNKASKYR